VSRRLRGWLVAAGLCAAAALGLPWSVVLTGAGSPAVLTGAGSPARVAIAVAVVLTVVGLRSGRDRLATYAVLAGAAGVLSGGLSPSPGRIALVLAVGCLAAGLHADGRPVVPGRATG
jgi:hypothetical protein